jgi:hypothetical protein
MEPGKIMGGEERWRALDDDALERLLVERWLYRGLLLAVIFVTALAVTWLGAGGAPRLVDRVTICTLLALAAAVAVVAFLMRQEDLRIIHELRRRGKS